MGQRVTIVTDYDTPITPDSERYVYAIEAKDEKKLATTLDKIMDHDPDGEARKFGEIVIWEIVEPQHDFAELELDAPLLASLGSEELEEAAGGNERLLPNSAVCVAHGHLLIAAGVDYMKKILTAGALNERLAGNTDYVTVRDGVRNMAGGPLCGWSFARLDQSVRPTYELLRQGKMPESNTTTGRLLNELLTTREEQDEGILREQRLDGSKLPKFEMVKDHFGPAGRILQSQPDGWMLTGAILTDGAPSSHLANQPVQ